MAPKLNDAMQGLIIKNYMQMTTRENVTITSMVVIYIFIIFLRNRGSLSPFWPSSAMRLSKSFGHSRCVLRFIGGLKYTLTS